MDALSIKRVVQKTQTLENFSFSGGSPNIPADIPWPECLHCGRSQTFFFQLQFPQEHTWAGKVLVVFHCVECNTAESMYPQFPVSFELVLSGFLQDYQTNFKLIVFDSAREPVIRTDHTPRIKYQIFKFNSMTKDIGYHTKVGGKPVWGAGFAQNPYLLEGEEMTFLMQTVREYSFPRLPDAPPQREAPFLGEARLSTKPYYTLFGLGAPLYFFGSADPQRAMVLVQVGK